LHRRRHTNHYLAGIRQQKKGTPRGRRVRPIRANALIDVPQAKGSALEYVF